MSLGSLGVATRLVNAKFLFSLCAFAAMVVSAGEPDHLTFKAAEEAQYLGQSSGRCLLHKRAMVKHRVPILYTYDYAEPGDPIPRRDRVQEFPHARHVAIRPPPQYQGAPTTTRIYICSHCEAAEARWRKEHDE